MKPTKTRKEWLSVETSMEDELTRASPHAALI